MIAFDARHWLKAGTAFCDAYFRFWPKADIHSHFYFVHLTMYDALIGRTNEAPRVCRISCGCRIGLAAWRTCAAARSPAPYRRIDGFCRNRRGLADLSSRFPRTPARLRLDRRTEHQVRISVCWRKCRAHTECRLRTGCQQAGYTLRHDESSAVSAVARNRTIPIVFTWVSESVGSGYVSSLAHPGGNVTGFHNFEPEVGGKWLGVLKQIAPQVRRVGFVHVPEIAANVAFIRAADPISRPLGMTVSGLGV